MNNFETALTKKIKESIYNQYDVENYDIARFGEYTVPPQKSIINKIKNLIKRKINYKCQRISNYHLGRLTYKSELNWLWNNIDIEGQKLLVELVAYRLLGYTQVKLSINNEYYHNALKIAHTLIDNSDTINPGFLHFTLYKMKLNAIGRDIQFYFSPVGVAIDFILEQYAYKSKGQTIIEAKPGDIVLDVGGCWGDTALYFADKVGKEGKVYSFEFIPGNINLHNKNTSLNPHLKTRIELITNPATDKTGEIIYFKDYGPGSQIKMEAFADQTGSITTLSIDDFVEQRGLKKVDFIKMDIEGAEPIALKGAVNTIKKYRPKLAIAIYHSMNDFVNIPRWIHDLNLDYNLYLAHYTIHAEETVIFAKPK